MKALVINKKDLTDNIKIIKKIAKETDNNQKIIGVIKVAHKNIKHAKINHTTFKTFFPPVIFLGTITNISCIVLSLFLFCNRFFRIIAH